MLVFYMRQLHKFYLSLFLRPRLKCAAEAHIHVDIAHYKNSPNERIKSYQTALATEHLAAIIGLHVHTVQTAWSSAL